MLMEDVVLEPPFVNGDQEPISRAVVVTGVERNSVAANAGVREGDLLLSVGDQPATSRDVVRMALPAPAPGDVAVTTYRGKWIPQTKASRQKYDTHVDRIAAIRVTSGGDQLTADFSLTTNNRGVSERRLKLTIPLKKWDVAGIKKLSSMGRFSVFGIDQTNRLVAFNLKTAELTGRIPVQGFDVHMANAVTDQVYLISSTGEVACLREIGPIVRLPDLSTISNMATVTKLHVKVNDPIKAAGTDVCDVELPDGTTHTISSNHKGTVKRVFVRVGDSVAIDDPLIRISDDKFATYHRRPQQQPIDVNMQDENAAPAPMAP